MTAIDQIATPVLPRGGRRPLGIGEVSITGGFWKQRQRTNASVTLPHIAGWLVKEGWVDNFDLAASGALPQGRRGREFSDSDVYKFLEAVAWELGVAPDEALERVFADFSARIAAAQEPDGYLNTYFGRPGQPDRWSDLAMGHELYCIGHLVQAAVARARTTGAMDEPLVRVAIRAADLVCETFGQDGIQSVCGHPEVEMALVELSRLTGDRRYLDQATLFVDRRGHGTLPDHEWGRGYYQDDVPVRDAGVLHGHAVRANYLAAGATDVAVETADAELLSALDAQQARALARRTYLTGGQGAHHQDEGFGEDWELPPDRAYAETCASVASIMFSWRLLLAGGEEALADQIERALYNMVAAGVSRSGDSFFYTNTLHRRVPGTAPRPDAASPRAFSSLRAPWFDVSCCPPNIARTLASLATLVATKDEEGLQLHQFAPASITTTLTDGAPVAVDVVTDYPRLGRVEVRVRVTTGRPWTLTLRIPSWAEGAVVTFGPVGGAEVARAVDGPTVALTESFTEGDVVTLDLPMEPRFVRADARVDASRGCVAVQRGPVVYCAEVAATEESDPTVTDLVVDPSSPPQADGEDVVVAGAWQRQPAGAWPYQPQRPADEPIATVPVRLIPYHAWGQSGLCTMRVWLPTR